MSCSLRNWRFKLFEARWRTRALCCSSGSEEEDEHDDTASRPVEGAIVIEDAPVVPEEPQDTDLKKCSRGDIAILTVQRNMKDLDGFEAKILATKAKEVKVELFQGPKQNTLMQANQTLPTPEALPQLKRHQRALRRLHQAQHPRNPQASVRKSMRMIRPGRYCWLVEARSPSQRPTRMGGEFNRIPKDNLDTSWALAWWKPRPATDPKCENN